MNGVSHYSFSSDGLPIIDSPILKKRRYLHPYISEDGKTVSVVGFVGYCDENEKQGIHVILPKQYPQPLEKGKDKEAASRRLLETLLKFRKKHMDLWREFVVRSGFNRDSFFVDMEFIIRDWKMYGLLQRQHRKDMQKGSGRINWHRTLHRVQPMISNGEPVYFPPILSIRDTTQGELIQKIHAYIVWSIIFDWGGLFGENWNQDVPARLMSKQEMCDVLRRELRGNYVEREIELFQAMIRYLEMQEGFGKNNSSLLFLVKFELIWEDICGTILDNQYNELKKYIPHAVYIPKEGVNQPVPSPIPDILCKVGNAEDKIYIFDAKYHKEPAKFYCDPCMKQFMYAYLINSKWKKEHNSFDESGIAANVFLLPGEDSTDVVDIGDIKLFYDSESGEGVSEDQFGSIKVLRLSIKKMMKEYVSGAEFSNNSMKNKIYDVVNEFKEHGTEDL